MEAGSPRAPAGSTHVDLPLCTLRFARGQPGAAIQHRPASPACLVGPVTSPWNPWGRSPGARGGASVATSLPSCPRAGVQARPELHPRSKTAQNVQRRRRAAYRAAVGPRASVARSEIVDRNQPAGRPRSATNGSERSFESRARRQRASLSPSPRASRRPSPFFGPGQQAARPPARGMAGRLQNEV